MQSKRHYSVRRHAGKPASHSSAAASSALFETLESRQLMSVAAPTVEPMGAMLVAAPSSSYALPAVQAAPDSVAVSPAVDAGVTIVAPGTGDEQPPPAGDDTAAAKSLWDRVKGAAKWVKNHVTATLSSIGIKGTF